MSTMTTITAAYIDDAYYDCYGHGDDNDDYDCHGWHGGDGDGDYDDDDGHYSGDATTTPRRPRRW